MSGFLHFFIVFELSTNCVTVAELVPVIKLLIYIGFYRVYFFYIFTRYLRRDFLELSVNLFKIVMLYDF